MIQEHAYLLTSFAAGGGLVAAVLCEIGRRHLRSHTEAIASAYREQVRLRNTNDWLETQLEMREQEAADLTAGLQVEVDRLNGIIADLEAFKAKRNMSRKQRAELAAPAPKAKPYVASANSLQAVAL